MNAMWKSSRFYPIWLAALAGLLLVGSASAAGFSVTDLKGRTHTLDGYRGKWVLVNYWATWCPPCLEEIPDLIDLHEFNKNRLVVIGVALDFRSAKQIADFAEQMKMSYPIVLGDKKVTDQIGPVQGLPTTYLFNPQGKLVAQQVGPLTREAVEAYIAGKTPAK